MHINVKNILVALTLVAGGFSLAFADVPLPKVKILGKTFYYYETQKDESLYGIAKRFGFDLETLAQTNKEVAATPDKGTLLYYPVDKIADENEQKSEEAEEKTAEQAPVRNVDTRYFHIVEEDESLYGIAREFGLTVDELMTMNPQLRNGSFTVGSELRIKEEEPSVDDYTEVISENESQDNASAASVAIILTDVGTSAEEKRNKKNKEMEFARGALTAVDEMKDGKNKIRLTIIDGSQEPEVVRYSLDSFGPKMIVTTSDKNIPEYIINYADSASVKLINSFDTKDERYLSNPNIVQFQVPSSYMNSEVAEYVANKFGDYTLLVAGNVDASDALGSAIIERFSQLGPDKVTEIDIAQMPELQLEEDFGKYLIYGTPYSQDDVQGLLKKVSDLRNRFMLSDIRVIGRPNWITYAKPLKELLGNNYTYVPSRFYFDPENLYTKQFIERYESLFSLRPMVSYPVYCATAYDIVKYFVPNIVSNPELRNGEFEYSSTIQSPLRFEHLENAGVVNKGVYLINFMPFGINDLIQMP